MKAVAAPYPKGFKVYCWGGHHVATANRDVQPGEPFYDAAFDFEPGFEVGPYEPLVCAECGRAFYRGAPQGMKLYTKDEGGSK